MEDLLGYQNEAFESCSAGSSAGSCMEERIRLNVRGTVFITDRHSALKHPSTLLSQVVKNGKEFYNPQTQEFVFNRDPYMFNSILNFYSTGGLHFRHDMCQDEVQKELEFWKINPTLLAPCCWVWLVQKDTLKKTCQEALPHPPGEGDGDNSNPPIKGWRKRTYSLLEEPNSSTSAQVWAAFILLMICISILGFILESVETCRVPRDVPFVRYTENMTQLKNYMSDRLNRSQPHVALTVLDIVTNTIFTMDLFLRWLVSPYKKQYCISLLNIIEVLAIIPTWLYLFFFGSRMITGISVFDDDQESLRVFVIVRGLRILRVLRLFRLVRTQDTMRIVLLSWKKSYKELILLGGLLSIMSIIYGSLAFFLESSDTKFESIPRSMWWSIITMTTVGYGDYYPVTVAGCLVGVICAVTGLVVVATPIPVIVSNFSALNEAREINNELEVREQRITTREEAKLSKKPAMSVQL